MITRKALLLVVALLVFHGCGGGSQQPPARPQVEESAQPAGPADLAAMRELLERYSPTGQYIVATYEGLPKRYVFGDTTISVTHDRGFDDYFDDGAPENLVDYMSTAVHEVYHAYSSLMGYQLLLDTQTERGVGEEAVYVGAPPMLVTFTPTYPTREMDATFPADGRTSRYETYVSPSQEAQSTQTEGIYALLDEMTAYYHSARTLFDFWPWVRDEAPRNQQLLVTYVARFHEMWVPYAEFELYILHYLRHARDHHPEVYQGIVTNQSFRVAFAACDDAYAELLAAAAELEPTIHEFARGRGVDAGLRDGQLTFDGSLFGIRHANYPALLRRLSSAPYQEIRAELRGARLTR